MGYHGCMGYEALFPANQLGGLKKVWNLREYGVCEPWVTRESTVINNSSTVPSIPFKHRTHLIFYGGVKTMSKAGSTKVEQMLCLAKALHAVSVLHILFIKGQPLISLYYFEGILWCSKSRWGGHRLRLCNARVPDRQTTSKDEYLRVT